MSNSGSSVSSTSVSTRESAVSKSESSSETVSSSTNKSTVSKSVLCSGSFSASTKESTVSKETSSSFFGSVFSWLEIDSIIAFSLSDNCNKISAKIVSTVGNSYSSTRIS